MLRLWFCCWTILSLQPPSCIYTPHATCALFAPLIVSSLALSFIWWHLSRFTATQNRAFISFHHACLMTLLT